MASTKLQNDKTPLHFARKTYIQSIINQNIIPILVSSIFSAKIIDILYQQSSGVLLMGGSDINPKLYKQKLRPETIAPEPFRDKLEINIIRRAFFDKKPMLCICRGIQVLNVALGGDLNQHILHHSPINIGKTYDHLFDSPGHQVLSKPKSLTRKFFGKKFTVNSYHHQSIKQLSPDLVATGFSNDGTIEIVESIDPTHFVFGTQFHPEVMSSAKNLFTYFAKKVKNY